MNGEPFDMKVATGDKVSRGTVLLEADLDKIKAAGYATTTPIIITNSAEYLEVLPVAKAEITAGQKVLQIKK